MTIGDTIARDKPSFAPFINCVVLWMEADLVSEIKCVGSFKDGGTQLVLPFPLKDLISLYFAIALAICHQYQAYYIVSLILDVMKSGK